MRLAEAIRGLDGLDEDHTLFVRRPWTPDAECIVESLDEEYRVPAAITAAGYSYFLDVSVLRELFDSPPARSASHEERVSAAIHYAVHDAPPQ